jgi:dTDP-D-glucose 4,6-dehydratase
VVDKLNYAGNLERLKEIENNTSLPCPTSIPRFMCSRCSELIHTANLDEMLYNVIGVEIK